LEDRREFDHLNVTNGAAYPKAKSTLKLQNYITKIEEMSVVEVLTGALIYASVLCVGNAQYTGFDGA
jgi:hypothetical protein